MSTQDIFNKVVNHMRAQGNPWGPMEQRGWYYINPENPCQRCAKGILMDVKTIEVKGKNLYVLDFPLDKQFGRVPSSAAIEKALNRELLPTEEQLLTALENIFEYHEVTTWEQRFKEIAERFKLNYSLSLGDYHGIQEQCESKESVL